MCNYRCRPATDADDVRKIARYIHLTDPYIYPHLCKDPADPKWVAFIAECLHTQNHIFHIDHLQVVLCNDQIIGLACVIPCGKALNFAEYVNTTMFPSKLLETVINGYFMPLIEESQNYAGFNMVNVCIDQDHQGKGIGTLLMAHCIRVYGQSSIHLDVIASNAAAVQLYHHAGFQIVNAYSGFSGDEAELPCYHMLYTPTAE